MPKINLQDLQAAKAAQKQVEEQQQKANQQNMISHEQSKENMF